MADSEHNVKININGNSTAAVGALARVKSALQGVQNVASAVTRALGWFHLAVNGVNALVSGFKWLKDKITETSREIAKLKFDIEMRNAANETSRLVGFHEKLAKLMKDELDTLAKQRAVEDIGETGRKDYEDGRREADRARQLYEAKTPEEEQSLRDRFAAEDERRSREEARAARQRRIRQLDGEDSVYASKANGLRANNAQIDAQLADERASLVRANGNEEAAEPIRKRIEALEQRKKANEAEIAQFEKESKFRRDQIAALESQTDYDGPTAGEWNRKAEAKRRAEEKATAEAEAKELAERESDARAREFVRGYEDDRRAEAERRASGLESFAAAAMSADGVSQNRLTAMGLGSGVSADGRVASDVKRLVELMKSEIEATKANKPTEPVATYAS